MAPISIAGWDVREGAMVTAFALSGVSNSDAVRLSIAHRLAIMLGGMPGRIIWLLAGGRRPAAASVGVPARPNIRR